MSESIDPKSLLEKLEALEKRVHALEHAPPAYVPPPTFGPLPKQEAPSPFFLDLIEQLNKAECEQLSKALECLRNSKLSNVQDGAAK